MLKNKLIKCIVPIVFLVITVFIYIPSDVYIGNLNDFRVSYGRVIPYIFLVAAAVFAVCTAVAIAIRKTRILSGVFIDLVFGFTLGMYVQSNFLNAGLEQLNGTEVTWNYWSIQGILSLAAWLICLVLPHVIRRISEDWEEKISFFGSILLTLMQIVSYIALLFSSSRSVPGTFALTTDGEFNLSAGGNTVVFVVDTLDAQWAEKYIVGNPQYDDLTEDFTYFSNVVSGGAPTVLGMTMMLTGQQYDDLSIPWTSYAKQENEQNTLFRDLKEKGFLIRLYTSTTFMMGTDASWIDNAIMNTDYRLSDPILFMKSLYKLTAYVGLPYQLKKPFWIYSGVLTDNLKLEEAANVYTLDDPQFYLDYQDSGISVTEEQPVFMLYHFFGAHGPYSMNEEAQKVEEGTISLQQQISGTMKIISEIITEMKEKDIYDSSTIIITADHGGVALYQNPAVFVKKAYDSHPFQINSAPLTFRNLRATFTEDWIDDYQEKYGPGMFDIPEDAEIPMREHTFDSILYLNVYPDKQRPSKAFVTCLIGNPARDNQLITWEEQESH